MRGGGKSGITRVMNGDVIAITNMNLIRSFIILNLVECGEIGADVVHRSRKPC